MFRRGIKSEILEAGSSIIRIHHKDSGAIWFGPKPGLPPAFRFDAPAREYRTMYAAIAIGGAFVETVLHGRTEEQIVGRAFVEQRAWTEFTSFRPLKLMKLYDDGLFWHGTDASISAMPSYATSRQIALLHSTKGPIWTGSCTGLVTIMGSFALRSSIVSQVLNSTLVGPGSFASIRMFAILSWQSMARSTTPARQFRHCPKSRKDDPPPWI
jgi:hypothetical protein